MEKMDAGEYRMPCDLSFSCIYIVTVFKEGGEEETASA